MPANAVNLDAYIKQNNMKFYQILFLALILTATSCVKNKKGVPAVQQTQSSENVFEVLEVLQTSNYTYLRVYENVSERWVAVSRMDVKKGDKLYYDNALQMNNFHSKELDRDFEIIYFINKVSQGPVSGEAPKAQMPANHSGNAKASAKSNVELEKTGEEITVAQVFEKRAAFADKEIEIRGIVVKVNKQVMGKNWIHIQDGTDHDGSFDLTITSQDLPEKGDEVTFKGTIILNKDFGAGYFYDVIMEDASMLNKKAAATKI